MITFPQPVNQSYFESLGYLMHRFIMVLTTYCNNCFCLLKSCCSLGFCSLSSSFLTLTYSWEILSMPMASTFTHKTDDFQICTSSPHLSPNLQIHTSSGLLDISTCLTYPMSQCQKLKLFSFCIPGQTYSSSSIVLCRNTIYSLKPETEQLFYSSSLLLLSFNTVRSSSEIFLKSLFFIPSLLLHQTKTSLL